MTTSKFISQLKASIQKLESLVQSLQCSSFQPSKTQYGALADLGLRLTAAANNLPIQVTALQRRRAEPSFKQGSKLLAQAQSEIRDLISTGQLKDRIIFGRNIVYFFDGQRDSVVDSDVIKTRKQLTRERCERICTLSPDGLISWAVAFMPTIWTANLMSKDTFDYVFEHIEPEDYPVWPPVIYHILGGLGAEEPLRESHKYHEFLKAAEDDKKEVRSTNQPRKRRRMSDGAASEGEPLSPVEISELVARTSDGQYASRGSKSPNKAAESEFNLFANLSDLAIEISVAPANNQVANSGQSHLAMNGQDHRLPLSPLPINDQARDPLSDISLNAKTILPRGTDSLTQKMQQVDGDSTSAYPRLPSSLVTGDRTGISTISALLNYDNNTPATALVTTQELVQDSANSLIEPVFDIEDQHLVPPAVPAGVVITSLGVIQFEKSYLQQIVIDRPADILGDIWFGSLPGFVPFVSLRLSEALGGIIKPSGREVFIPSPAPDANRIFKGVYSIESECFIELVQRDGFGGTFWNETGGKAFVSVEVMDEQLVADFIRVGTWMGSKNNDKIGAL